MTVNVERYASSGAVESAIKDAAKKAHEADPNRQVGDLIRQAHYDRFLCRVFAEGDESEWVLKGGNGILARVPNARRTQDVDIYWAGFDKDQALAELRRVTQLDLGDFFLFVYRSHADILIDDLQPYADGYRVVFDAYLGVQPLDPIMIDLSAHERGTDSLTITDPANRLILPKLPTYPYRLYPIVNQVADKVCATIATYSGRPSSREKDLVDLVIIAATQIVNAASLRSAMETECRKRHLQFPQTFSIPSAWGPSYSKLSKNTPAQCYNIDSAKRLIDDFIGHILITPTSGIWNPQKLRWEST